MKTKEELTAIKEEFEVLSKKLAELTEEELAQVSGGDLEITFDTIMEQIEAKNDYMAREYFDLVQYSLAPLEAYTIRMTFWNKFGYPIDKIGE